MTSYADIISMVFTSSVELERTLASYSKDTGHSFRVRNSKLREERDLLKYNYVKFICRNSNDCGAYFTLTRVGTCLRVIKSVEGHCHVNEAAESDVPEISHIPFPGGRDAEGDGRIPFAKPYC